MLEIIIFLVLSIAVLEGEASRISGKSGNLKNKIAENEKIEDHIDKRKKEVFENESLEQEECCC